MLIDFEEELNKLFEEELNKLTEYESVKEALKQLVDLMFWSQNYPLRPRTGQGEVFHSLMDYFEKDRLRVRMYAAVQIAIRKAYLYYYKNAKSLIEPVPLKGWKGGRN